MPPPDASPPPSGYRILVVDDEKPVRMVAQRMLERLGHQVTVALDSAGAIAAAAGAEAGPQLVLIDMHLGEEDGLHLARSLRALLPASPIVIMGGDIDDQARQTAARAPRMHLLAKPFAFGDLQEVLKAAFGGTPAGPLGHGDSCLSPRDSANIAASNGH